MKYFKALLVSVLLAAELLLNGVTPAQAQARAVTTTGVVTLRGVTSGTLSFTNNSLLKITFTTSIASIQTAGLTLENTTTPANGSQEFSPSLQLCGTADNTSVGHVKETDCWRIENRPATNSGATSHALTFSSSIAGAAYTALGNIDKNGTFSMQQFSSANSSYYQWNGRSRVYSSADSLVQMENQGASLGLEFNAGTAAPTVTSCGTGAITAGSRNTAGEVTATGATACTLTFGTPAFTNAPFCIVEDETTAVAQRISAISTTAFTVTGLTSGDKFMYICIGRI